MGWFRHSKRESKTTVKSEDLWTQCPKCSAHVFREEWERAHRVCPACNYHGRLTCDERLALLLDPGSFKELAGNVRPGDPLRFVDAKGSYAAKLKTTMAETGLTEAVKTGSGTLHGRRLVMAAMDFRFIGGSLGSGTGERILRAASYALKHRLPYIIVSASGGARMQEGMVSLMQMAKTCAGIARLRQAGVPYISILTDPTAGGVSASYAMIGDINIAEPGALIAFAGRRVIEQTIKEKLPDDFQTAEYLLEHGFLDQIVNRGEMRDRLHAFLEYCCVKL